MQPSDYEIRAMLAGATRSAEAMRTTDGWSIVAPYMCINGISALFTLARVSDPDEAEIGYTDGALDAETARANAALYAAAPDVAALALSRGDALAKAEAEVARLTAAIAVKGGTEHAPTEDAYLAACAAIEKHRTRADKAEAENARLKKALWLMAREYERWHRVGDDRIEKRPYEQQTRAVQAAWDALGGDDA